jgi:hypothetical protein
MKKAIYSKNILLKFFNGKIKWFIFINRLY